MQTPNDLDLEGIAELLMEHQGTTLACVFKGLPPETQVHLFSDVRISRCTNTWVKTLKKLCILCRTTTKVDWEQLVELNQELKKCIEEWPKRTKKWPREILVASPEARAESANPPAAPIRTLSEVAFDELKRCLNTEGARVNRLLLERAFPNEFRKPWLRYIWCIISISLSIGALVVALTTKSVVWTSGIVLSTFLVLFLASCFLTPGGRFTDLCKQYCQGRSNHPLVWIISVLVDLAALITIFVAGVEGWDGIKQFLQQQGDEAVKFLIKGLDALLMAVVMFLFASGLRFLLLLPDNERKRQKDHYLAGRAGAEDFYHLKGLLISAIVIIIVVRYLAIVLSDPYNVNWESLAIPIGVLLLSSSAWLLKMSHPKPESSSDKKSGLNP